VQQLVCPSLSPHIQLLSLSYAVRLQTGNLAVFSPVTLTDKVRAHLQTLGPVAYITAPDIEHHIHLSSWSAAYPNAHIIGPEGLPEKRAKANGSDKSVTLLNFGTIFAKKGKENIKVTEEFDREFDYEFIEAHPNKEIVFHHKPSRTLIEADLLFNLPAKEQYSKTNIDPSSGIFTKLAATLQSAQGTAIWQKRILWYAFSSSDRPSFNKSIQKIESWDFVNIVPCHGDSWVGDGKGVFQKVMQWHLEGKRN
jgi:hypothetical protein